MSRPLLLLVDDEPDLGVIVRRLAGRSGCDVNCCTDVPEAWAALETTPPDLVLLDVRLPGESGLDWCRRLRATPPWERLAIALFTHWGLPGDVAAGIDAGADFVFAKELICDPEAWRARLAEILAHVTKRKPPYSQTEAQAVQYSWLPSDWTASLRLALHHPSIRRLGLEVVRAFLRRAAPPGLVPPSATPDPGTWLLSDEWTLAAWNAFPASPPETVAAFIARLAELVWSLLGTEASGPFQAALAEGFPNVPRFPPSP
jgi:CheY-like chemotaxis protein